MQIALGKAIIRNLRRILLTGALLCLFNPPSGASPSATVYTNTENVRRIAVGSQYVAFATSGGIRIYQRKTNRWRTMTINQGLPTNDILNVAFDPDNPNILWALGLIGAYEGWKSLDQRLVLTSINLKTQAVHIEASYQPAPDGYTDSPPYTVPSSLRVDQNEIYVTVGISNLRYDRKSGRWTVLPAFPIPKESTPNVITGIGAFKLTRRGHFIFLLGRYGIIASNTSRHTLKYYPISTSDVERSVPGQYSLPFNLRYSPTAVTCQMIEQNSHWNDVNIPVISGSRLITLRIAKGANRFQVVAARNINQKAVAILSHRAGRDYHRYLHSSSPTDLALDGDTIWFATYNFPGIRATGIARYNIRRKKWSYPKPDNGLAANMIYRIVGWKDHLYVDTTNGVSEYAPLEDNWLAPTALVPPETGNGLVSIYRSNILGYTQHPPQNLQILAREGDQYDWIRKKVPVGATKSVTRWAIGRLDRKSRKLESFAQVGDLPDISVGSMLIEGDVVWLMGTDVRSRPAKSPLVIRWNRTTNQMALYSGGAIASIPSIAQTDAIPRACFISVAGGTWIWGPYDHKLLRYDPNADKWRLMTENAANVYEFAGSDSVWVRTPGGAFFRWNAKGGWLQVVIPPKYDEFLGDAFYPGVKYYWFGKIGVLKLSRDRVYLIPASP